MTTVIVNACAVCRITASGAKTETMCLLTEKGGKAPFTATAAGQMYKQTVEFVYLGGAISAESGLCVEVSRRLQRAWSCSRRNKVEIYDRPGLRLRLKVRMLKAEAIETLLYGSVT